MAYMIEDKLRDAAKEVDKEKALKEVVEATVKDKDKAVKNAEERIRAAERARALAEQRVGGLKVKLRGMELKLAEAESLNSAGAKEIAALEASEEKWFNTGFADAENSIELIIYQSRRYRFGEGWMAALQVMGVLDDSLLRNRDQIPYLNLTPPVQNPTGVEEEDTPSMRELVKRLTPMQS